MASEVVNMHLVSKPDPSTRQRFRILNFQQPDSHLPMQLKPSIDKPYTFSKGRKHPQVINLPSNSQGVATTDSSRTEALTPGYNDDAWCREF